MDSSNAPDAVSESPAAEPANEARLAEQSVGRYTVDRTSGLYQRSSSSRHGRSRHGGSREAKLQRRVWVARIFAFVAVVGAVVVTMIAIRTHSELATVEAENNTLASELNRAQNEADRAKKLVAAQEVELGALLRQRIPGVSLMELDKLYDVNNRHVKKISFSESGVAANKRLTYYAVLKNTGNAPINPAAAILLFDRKGLQTGMARIERAAATPATDKDELAPGETRTYSAPVVSVRPDKPHYFLVEIQ